MPSAVLATTWARCGAKSTVLDPPSKVDLEVSRGTLGQVKGIQSGGCIEQLRG